MHVLCPIYLLKQSVNLSQQYKKASSCHGWSGSSGKYEVSTHKEGILFSLESEMTKEMEPF